MIDAVATDPSLSAQELRAARGLALPRVTRALDPVVVVQSTGMGRPSGLLARARHDFHGRPGPRHLCTPASPSLVEPAREPARATWPPGSGDQWETVRAAAMTMGVWS